MSIDDKEEKPLRRAPPSRPPQPPAHPPPSPYPQLPPPVGTQRIPPPAHPPPSPYPQLPPPVGTQRIPPPAQPPQPMPLPQTAVQPIQEPPRRVLRAEKPTPLPLLGTVIALVAAMLGIITGVMSVLNESLAFPLLATSIIATNIVLIVVLVSIWKLLRK